MKNLKKLFLIGYILLSVIVVSAQPEIDSTAIHNLSTSIAEVAYTANDHVLPNTPKQIIFSILGALTGVIIHWFKIKRLKDENK